MRSIKQNRADELIEKVNDRFETLVKNLDKKESEEEIKNYFRFMSKFHNYSLRNQMLIALEANSRGVNIEHVASFKKWNELKNDEGKRASVKKGEKGFSILVPITYIKYELDKKRNYIFDENGKKIPKLDEHGNIEKGLKFKAGTVFDVNQTTAKEIGAYKTLEYRAKIDINESLFNTLVKEISKKFNVTVSQEPTGSRAKGYYSPMENKIVVDPSYSTSEKISTLFHELGHHQMHGKQLREGTLKYEDMHKNRGAREGEAESFSYILSSMTGIENKSELYIKTWGNSAKDLKERFELITGAAKEAINSLDLENIISKELKNSKQAENEKEFESSILKDLRAINNTQKQDATLEITRS